MTNSTPPMDRFLDESVLADFTALRMTAFGKTGLTPESGHVGG
ncbi:transposase [Corynebacterium striatum]|nr:hypothetical protein [Corynebacterium striatum]STD38351.1 transposase [Corynebacterium striatum]